MEYIFSEGRKRVIPEREREKGYPEERIEALERTASAAGRRTRVREVHMKWKKWPHPEVKESEDSLYIRV